MSNLVADAEDLLSRLQSSPSPETRALQGKVESSISEIKTLFRERVKRPKEPIENLAISTEAAIILAVSVATIAAVVYFAAFKKRHEG
jgi:hypothetical protein